MYVASDSIRIDASPREAFGFFRDMDRERYLAWHPGHIDFRYVEGEGLGQGSVIRFEERIGDESFAVKFECTTYRPPELIEFHPTNPVWRLVYPESTMELREDGGGCVYRSRNCFRVGPLGRLGPVQSRLELVEQHMREEGRYLKDWVEGRD